MNGSQDRLWSVDDWLRHGRSERRLQEIEITSLVGLADVLGEHPTVAALEAWRGRSPGGAALHQLFFRDFHADRAPRHIDRDDVAGPQECQRATDVGLRRHMQNAGAIA